MAGIQVAGSRLGRSFGLDIGVQRKDRPWQRRHLLQLHDDAAGGNQGFAGACTVLAMQAESTALTYTERSSARNVGLLAVCPECHVESFRCGCLAMVMREATLVQGCKKALSGLERRA